MDFIHRPVSQDKKTKNYRQKIKTRTDQKQKTNVHKKITQGTNYKPQSNIPGHTHKHLKAEKHRWQ
jgi:hypothetical protein